jgi:acyl-CoA synthetase (NDP forming)
MTARAMPWRSKQFPPLLKGTMDLAAGEQMFPRSLTPLLKPKSVAVIGASARVGSRGNSAVRNLQEFGFSGAIYPINPNADEICGLKVYRTPLDLPAGADCAIVAVPAESVVPVLREAAQAGVKSAVIFASGFAEAGAKGIAAQQALVNLAQHTGLAICGPNCLGLANITERISLYSSRIPEHILPGGVAVISQSGSGCILLSNLKRFGFSFLVTTGNSAVIDVADYLDFVADDLSTRIAALFVESIRDPRAFAAAAAKMHAAGKPVVVLKVGRSDKGARATVAHTGSLAGAHEAYEDFFRRNGVIGVDDLDELVESVALMQNVRYPAGRGVAAINVSGGEVAMTCDIAEQIGLDLPDLAAETISQLKSILPDYGHAANPLDATGTAVSDLEMYGACIKALASDPGIALVAVSQDSPADLGAQQGARYGKLAAVAAEVAGTIQKPLVFFNNLAGGIHPDVAAPLVAAGVPALQGARTSLLAIRRLIDFAAHKPSMQADVIATASEAALAKVWRPRLASGKGFNEGETRDFLVAHGIKVGGGSIAHTAEQASETASALACPVVLKVVSADLPHKTEVGGVMLNVSPADAARAFSQIMSNVKSKAPAAKIDGIAVDRMIVGGTEVIIGLSHQPPFGQMITVGAGGVLVELVHDAVAALLPLDQDGCLNLLKRTRVWTLLNGFRGSKPADVPALINLIFAISQIGVLYDDVINELELNPVSVQPEGAGVAILDSLLVPRATSAADTAEPSPDLRLAI